MRSISNGPAMCHHSPSEVRQFLEQQVGSKCPRCGRPSQSRHSYECRRCRLLALSEHRQTQEP